MVADELGGAPITAPSFIYSNPEADTVLDFLDDACRVALDAIGGRSAGRKRWTVVCLVLARLNGAPIGEVFADPRTGSASMWYEHWQYEPLVRTAYTLLLKRAFLWRERETLNVEIQATHCRRRALVQASLDAVESLRAIVTDPEAPVKSRIELGVMLLAMVDEIIAGRVAMAEHGKSLPLNIEGLDEFIGQELERLTAEYEAETGAA